MPDKKHIDHCEKVLELAETVAKTSGASSMLKWLAAVSIPTVIAVSASVIVWQMDKVTCRLDKINDSVSKIELAQATVSGKFEDHERRILAFEARKK